MRPILFSIGDFSVPSYGFFYMLAFLSAIFFGAWLGHKSTGERFSRLVDLAFLSTIGGEVAARLMFVVVEWDRFAAGRISFNEFLVGGRVVLAGIVGGAIVFSILIKRWKLPLTNLLDAGAVAIPLGMAIGRIGCWLGGCCYGKHTTERWGITFVHPLAEKLNGTPLNQALIPTQPLQMIEGFVWFLLLWWVHRHRRFPGQVIALVWILTGISRFLIEFLRGDRRGSYAGLATSQWIALVTVLLGTIGFVIMQRRARRA